MSTTHPHPHQADPGFSRQTPIVVAVDGSERNRSAVEWAADEAAAVGAEVVLVTALEERMFPTPHKSIRHRDEQARDMLADARHDVRNVVDENDVRTSVVFGPPVEAILQNSHDARLIVVGKRGLSSFARVLVGSTSIALAGRATVPVAIIPDSWKQDVHRGAPVVLGVDPYKVHHRPFHLAFNRAERLGVPLIAVHGWEPPTVYSWDAAAVAAQTSEWETDSVNELHNVMGPWQERFPDVTVEIVHEHKHPAMAVLDAAANAQSVVLGRHTDSRLGGFTFGSVARAVLHYSECPVVVVPAED